MKGFECSNTLLSLKDRVGDTILDGNPAVKTVYKIDVSIATIEGALDFVGGGAIEDGCASYGRGHYVKRIFLWVSNGDYENQLYPNTHKTATSI